MQKHKSFSNEIKQFIESHYLQEYSVSKLIVELGERFSENVGRTSITNYLKEIGVYEGLNGPNYLRKKTENNVKIMNERYGVDNWGQIDGEGWSKLNSIPYQKVSYLDGEFTDYRKKVDKLSKKNKKNIAETSYCFYTGIRFVDVEQDRVNPNDPRKRTLDHKIPIIICYLNGIDYEDAASVDNLIYVLRYVNSIKSNTDNDSFIPIAQKIRKVFLNEGFESKEIT